MQPGIPTLEQLSLGWPVALLSIPMSELALALLGAAVAVALFLGIRQGQGLLQRWAATQRLGEARALVAGAFVQPDGRAVGVSWG
ncbi:hypothetical protein CYA_2725 [Synechococcus sp. JA-3-3Ab]|nr:hypothetical protein CYA_2725 [Synechococcus sp. JA-3-3Ab]